MPEGHFTLTIDTIEISIGITITMTITYLQGITIMVTTGMVDMGDTEGETDIMADMEDMAGMADMADMVVITEDMEGIEYLIHTILFLTTELKCFKPEEYTELLRNDWLTNK